MMVIKYACLNESHGQHLGGTLGFYLERQIDFLI